ncbi:MAG: peptide chain release factor 1 [Candidatus Omnitrophica bacterium]|nr:peptide chain release factor 1 [Candidatus Omnitrophota bacterium]MCA9432319.1 peptide chain release factor 1 [Candidatus Omnitrophota bacterium]MCA9445696.1 peptide chain release factor 1 [Candidatus Omnitrophota bacterium]
MLEKLPPLEDRLAEVESQLSDPTVASDPKRLRDLGKSHSQLRDIVTTGRELRKVLDDLGEAKGLLNSGDAEMKELAQEEIPELEKSQHELVERFRYLLAPKDPDDEKNTIVEIRGGTGGDEAAIFAGDLFRMYCRFAERMGWKIEILDEHASEAGGFKEIVFEIQGEEVFSRMKFEGGVHRVQRVPETESQGRIHTSAATVAVLPEAEEIEIDIPQSEIRVDRFCSSGPGGQSVNTTYSAVRVTHLPSGIVASCQDEKSQIKNLDKAMRVLRARLLEKKRSEEEQARGSQRKAMVGSGDRSERIRTYNFPQSRISDHRITFTTHALREVMDGDLDVLLEPLMTADRMNRMQQA